MARKRLGELLLDSRMVTPSQLDEALAYQRQTGLRLGAALVALGFISEAQLCETLAQALGLRSVPMPPDPEEIDREALRSVRSRFCEANDLFPLSLLSSPAGRRTLTVAMADPLNLPAIEELEFTVGAQVVPVIAPLSGIRTAIRRHYSAQGAEEPKPPVAEAPDGELSERTSLAELIRKRAEENRQRRTARGSENPRPRSPALPSPLGGEGLPFGVRSESPSDELAKLETRFWALLRLMASKGLVSREEFLREIADLDD